MTSESYENDNNIRANKFLNERQISKNIVLIYGELCIGLQCFIEAPWIFLINKIQVRKKIHGHNLSNSLSLSKLKSIIKKKSKTKSYFAKLSINPTTKYSSNTTRLPNVNIKTNNYGKNPREL